MTSSPTTAPDPQQQKPHLPVQLYVTLATFLGCPADQLDDEKVLANLLVAACERAGFTQLHISVQRFDPQGVTGVAIIGESHIAIHTWPEHGTLFLDVASCSTYESTQLALQTFERAFAGAEIIQRNDIIHSL